MISKNKNVEHCFLKIRILFLNFKKCSFEKRYIRNFTVKMWNNLPNLVFTIIQQK